MLAACRYMSSLGNKKVELFDMGAGTSEPTAEENIQMASCETYFKHIIHLIYYVGEYIL